MDILSEYTYYLSDKFLRLIPGRNILWFRNESWEEGEQLRKVLQPESYRLRCEIRDQAEYVKHVARETFADGDSQFTALKRRKFV